MRIVIETIPHKDQRYPTSGDWQFADNGDLTIKVSHTQWSYDACLIVHELIEALCCAIKGISTTEVDDFDIKFEADRKQGDKNEPGDDPKAPYYLQHKQAEVIERITASFLHVDWRQYESAIDNL